jgi:hypothetical protein
LLGRVRGYVRGIGGQLAFQDGDESDREGVEEGMGVRHCWFEHEMVVGGVAVETGRVGGSSQYKKDLDPLLQSLGIVSVVWRNSGAVEELHDVALRKGKVRNLQLGV